MSLLMKFKCALLTIYLKYLSYVSCIINQNINSSNIFSLTYLKDPMHKVIMAWSPKSDSSEMVAMFFQNMNIYQNINYTGVSHSYQNKFFELYGNVMKDEFHSNNWYKFKVVRDPYTRAVSSYYHVMKTTLNSIYFNFNKVGKSKSINNIEENDLFLRKNASFIQFYEYYLKYFIVKKQHLKDGGHVRPQAAKFEIDYNKKFNKSIFNYIVHIENFDHDISVVNKKTKQHYYKGLYKDTHTITKTNDYNNITFLGNYPFSFFRKDKKLFAPYDHKLFYDKQTIKLISKIFAIDFELYNYQLL